MTALAKDGDGRSLDSFLGTALVTTYNGTISSTVQVTLGASTKYIEVAAIAQAVLLRWGTGAASTAAFDAVIPAGSVRRFRVPYGVLALNVIQQAATAVVAITEF
jgi:hypothetical protein